MAARSGGSGRPERGAALSPRRGIGRVVLSQSGVHFRVPEQQNLGMHMSNP